MRWNVMALALGVALAGCEDEEKVVDTGPVLSEVTGTGGVGTGGAGTGGAGTGTAGAGTGGAGTGGAGTGGAGTGTGGAGTGGTGTGGGGCAPTAVDDLPDLSGPTSDPVAACSEGPVWDALPGHASWYSGDYAVDACGVASGSETWHVIANDPWIAAGGGDCVVVWQVEGEVDDGAALSTGTAEWAVTLTTDATLTTCTPEMAGPDSADTTYRVTLGGDASFAFPSGTVFGTGAWNPNHAAWRSEVSCSFL
ncbi:MAG: hypothetical protein ACI8PZ_000578 [Myxococcota bacterium]|jgi:hypothetical protein